MILSYVRVFFTIGQRWRAPVREVRRGQASPPPPRAVPRLTAWESSTLLPLQLPRGHSPRPPGLLTNSPVLWLDHQLISKLLMRKLDKWSNLVYVKLVEIVSFPGKDMFICIHKFGACGPQPTPPLPAESRHVLRNLTEVMCRKIELKQLSLCSTLVPPPREHSTLPPLWMLAICRVQDVLNKGRLFIQNLPKVLIIIISHT